MNAKEFKDLVNQLAKEWDEAKGYETYNSILEFLDESFDRNFYQSIDPNMLIHEEMRNQLDVNIPESRSIIVSGLMECYDFCNQTKDMSDDEVSGFENFKD